MNNLMKFEDVELAVIDRDGQQWFTAGDVAAALGYSSDREVRKLYSRHQDEFTDSMSGEVKVTLPAGGRQDVRVFSLRGAHLVAMLARTPRARAFRAWALDLIEAEQARLRDPGFGRDAVTASLARALYAAPAVTIPTEDMAHRQPELAPLAIRQLAAELRSAEAAQARLIALIDGSLADAAPQWIERLAIERRAIDDLRRRIARLARLAAAPAIEDRS